MANINSDAFMRPIKSMLGSWRLALGMVALVAIILFADLKRFTKRRHTHTKNFCHNNLLQLEGAKKQWAEDHHKSIEAIPSSSELIGTDRYIKIRPECPANGAYTIGAVGELPQCSQAEHQFQYLIMRRSYPWTQPLPFTCADNLRLFLATKIVMLLEQTNRVPNRLEIRLELVLDRINRERKYLERFGFSPKSIKLRCPSGGNYTVGSIDQPPKCSVAGHAIKN